MPDRFGNPLPGENTGVGDMGFNPTTPPSSGNPATGSYGTTTGQFTDGPNRWLQSAMGNTQRPNLNYQSYLKSLGFEVEDDKVGKFFSGITDQYSQDINMARSGMSQNMQGLQSGATNQLMQIGGGQGLQGAYNPGFGRTQYGLNQAISGIGDQYSQGLQGGLLDFTQQKLDAQRDVQSEIRDVAMGLIGQDASGISWGDTGSGGGDNKYPTSPHDLPGWNPPATPEAGQTTYMFGEQQWIWDGGSWITQQQYDDETASYYETDSNFQD